MNMNQKAIGLFLALIVTTGIASADPIFDVSYDFNGDDSQAANFTFLGNNTGWTSDGGVDSSGAIFTQCITGGNYDIQFNQTFDVASHTVVEYDYKGTYNNDAIRFYFGSAYLGKVSGWVYNTLGTGGTWHGNPTWYNLDWNHLKFDINNGIINVYVNGSETPCAENYDASALLSETSVIKLHFANYPDLVTIDNFVASSYIPEPATFVLLGLGGLFSVAKQRKA